MKTSLSHALGNNFLGASPLWYKQAVIAFLIINPIAVITLGPFITGWLFIIEFIFTLAMALKCYPLQPGGLIAIQAVLLGLTSSDGVYHEVNKNFDVILLLMFMVAGIYFMKDMLLFIFNKLLVRVKSKIVISLIFSFSAALLSAFLDALTVTAVLISVGVGFYSVYHKAASGQSSNKNHDHAKDDSILPINTEDLNEFRSFLRDLLMHGAVGTALGGVSTLVGEPQNLLIAKVAGWDFIEFFLYVAPVSMPVLACGLLTVVILEKTAWFDYGAQLPDTVRDILNNFEKEESQKQTNKHKAKLIIQGIVAVVLILSLAFHIAEVGLVGLMVIVLLTAFNGITDEHQIGHAFEEALPFTALLVVFFTIVSVIHEQHLFQPIIDIVLHMPTDSQPIMFFIANGILSAISDNVFVATVYISEVKAALDAGTITREHFNTLAVAINTGTNLPSVATPNGQAAFLFLLTSAIAPLLRLSYGKMVWMALPYTVVLSVVGGLCVTYFL
ncbi:MAG: sodium/proton antiporter NhaB [Gammaproteobacteria bacterium]|jgi:NhaB family Na+:H+ antiporter|uniref:sodium/proton antiporter NhaB n=1 Tax=Marinomonas TaxID=28253 RepID=UPI000C1E66A9|nr:MULTISPECIES: sodium/proton antiporter NhaB [unclassified Marinomonas]MBU1466227.1 sodium/proton antiporter NhaB [Gammaproteobacteria bacterium]MBU2024420.1 sodium/proton antiporter NhaB [Gammaproteobacteria bacterium]MBU2237279.1 sodium/proton antiporter NhaB [Gammaproteobacteria bacterium]MBU2319679.1 sodium/proton antiporter NhaB [Gammaproteobacteria bacterium]MBU2411658.1 sodium/proton antiporter NhaB [Gammaproteobacteria bacterium]